MGYGETKSVFENKRVIVVKVNLCIFDVGVWKRLVVTDVKVLYLTACLTPKECVVNGCFP
jgi:hypothetical protein